ncbi:MAG: phosphoadenosine phosphosulfate reductase family protein [Candidatus Omnitrophica bacterium]|nr:phosphoadenosine phosphosulfate reductase family protein [Candidatus Omnitrophota bacterium]
MKFYVARNDKHSLELWKIFGPPSRIIRWCCSVCKTSPQVRLLRALNPEKEKEKLKILVFEGVRAEESARRSRYERVSQEAKHYVQINAEVIRDWSLSEVFMYLLRKNIPLNEGYRYGLCRIGCSICPFGSPWSEFILRKKFSSLANSYLEIIKEYSANLSVTNIEKYIAEGQWKKRAGGKGIKIDSYFTILGWTPNIKAVLHLNRYRKEHNLEWIKVLGKGVYKKNGENLSIEINVKDEVYTLNILKNNSKIYFEAHGVYRENLSIFKKLLNKITYCISCGACEAECENNALRVIPYVRINQNNCKHCYKCLDFISTGCILSSSLRISEEEEKFMDSERKVRINRYFTFGFREEWLRFLFRKRDEWAQDNNLGPEQVKAFISWLEDSEMLAKNKITDLGNKLAEIFKENELLAWEIIWINLFYNSSIIRWYLTSIPWSTIAERNELQNTLKESFPVSKERTLNNAFSSLLNTFRRNTLITKLNLGNIEKKGKEVYIKKIGTDDVHPLAVLYSLYRYAIAKNKYRFTVSELYREDNKDGGPYLIFGISRPALENILRWLQENKRDLIRVDLVADLDNIHLCEDIKDYTKILDYY